MTGSQTIKKYIYFQEIELIPVLEVSLKRLTGIVGFVKPHFTDRFFRYFNL